MVDMTLNKLLVVSCLLGAAAGAGAQGEPPAATDIRFRDFFSAPIGPAGLEIGPVLKASHGKRVRLTGYMVAQDEPPVARFFLAPLPLRMSEHADGEADDLPPSTVVVSMPVDDMTRPLPRVSGLMQLTGVLQVGRHELPDGRVTWVRLLLDPQNTNGSP